MPRSFYPSFYRPISASRFSDLSLPPQVKMIADQLAAYTGQSFEIDFISQHDTAQAQKCPKRIQISRCYVYSPPHHREPPLSQAILAGILAHEWGHLIDRSNSCTTPSSSRLEYNADVFAAQFLARHNYPIEPYVAFCIKRPEVFGDIHGTHAERASRLRRAYSLGSSVVSSGSSSAQAYISESSGEWVGEHKPWSVESPHSASSAWYTKTAGGLSFFSGYAAQQAAKENLGSVIVGPWHAIGTRSF